MTDPEPQRVRFRMMRMPVEREYVTEPLPEVTGRDGKTRSGDYLRRSLGLPSAPGLDDDYGVTWSRWPP